jgi:hypothetical protein
MLSRQARVRHPMESISGHHQSALLFFAGLSIDASTGTYLVLKANLGLHYANVTKLAFQQGNVQFQQ